MPSPCTSDPNEPLHPFVMLLKIFLKEEGRLEKLDAAVKASIAEEIFELKDWNITNGEDFLHFASCLLKHWIPSENQSGTFVYQVCTVFYCEYPPTLQSYTAKLSHFDYEVRKLPCSACSSGFPGSYFRDCRILTYSTGIFNHAELNDLQTVMKPSSIKSGLPDVTPVSQWIVGYAHLMGEWFDQPNSITPESYASFWQAKSYRMEDYLIPNPGDEKVGGFTSFNEFFCRFLKEKYPYPNVRPIAEINDPNVVISPADAIFDGHWAVDQQNNVKIKTLEWPISALLHGCPPQYIDKFKGGTWCHSFLNTFNYHRQHAPVAGKVSDQCSMRFIEAPSVDKSLPSFLFEVALPKISCRRSLSVISSLSMRPDFNAD